GAEGRAELLADLAGQDVGGAPRGERHDVGDGLRRPVAAGPGGRAGDERHRRGVSEQAASLHGGRPVHCGSTPASFTSLAKLAISLLMYAPNSAGVEGAASSPSWSSCALTSGAFTTLTASAF